MKKVLIIESSPRKGFCTSVATNISQKLKGVVDAQWITLRDMNFEMCCGCAVCLHKGSDYCPYRSDDVKILLDKIMQADGVIYVVPNYSLHVPANMKNVLDRLAYNFHRPKMFGKVCMPVIVQGVIGGGKIAAYINEVMSYWGMKTIKGIVLTGGVYANQEKPEAAQASDDLKISKAVEKFCRLLYQEKVLKPSFVKVFIFRATRSSMKYFEEALPKDKEYFKEKGWDEAPYYYKVGLNPLKKLAGAFMDKMIKSMAAKADKKKVRSEEDKSLI